MLFNEEDTLADQDEVEDRALVNRLIKHTQNKQQADKKKQDPYNNESKDIKPCQ